MEQKRDNNGELCFGKVVQFTELKFEVVIFKTYWQGQGHSVSLYTRMIGDKRPPDAHKAVIKFTTEADRDLFFNKFSTPEAVEYLEGQAAILRATPPAALAAQIQRQRAEMNKIITSPLDMYKNGFTKG